MRVHATSDSSAGTGRFMTDLLRDARVAVCGFRRAPSFTLTAVLVLALAIGSATAMFTVSRAVLLERLPIVDPAHVVVLRSLNRGSTKVDPAGTVITDMQRDARTVRGVAGVYHWGAVPLPMLDGERQIVMNRTAVTANFFDVLGVRPLLGRLLRPEDGVQGAPHVMVLSYATWQRLYAGDPGVIGHRLIEPSTDSVYTIVGVAPPGLDYPTHADEWEAEWPAVAKAQQLVVARLAPGATPAAAAAEYFRFVKRVETQGFGIGTFTGAEAHPLSVDITGGVAPILWALSAAVALLLLIACVNVGNLLLLRASTRRRELAIRRAVGATYLRLVRQLVVESVLLAAAGGALGIALAWALLHALVAASPRELPRLDLVHLDADALLTALGVTAAAVLLFGLAPALAAARGDVGTPLRGDARTGTGTVHRALARRLLVGSQVALALVLVAGAGLLARSVARLESIPLGYSSDHLAFFSILYPLARYDSPAKEIALAQQLDLRFRDVPGVIATTPVLDPPMSGADLFITKLMREDQSPDEGEASPFVPWEVGGADYFRTFGIPILRGRGFRDSDDGTGGKVAVISEALARRLFPGRDPIGQRLKPAGGYGDRTKYYTVIGVAGDTHYRELRKVVPEVYWPFRQTGWQGMFAVRTSRDLGDVLPAIRRAAADVDPQLSIWNVRTMDQLLDAPLSQPRLAALLLTGFGAAALLLAAIGLYGVMAFSVRERTRELGVRMALGAMPAELRVAVFRQALSIAGIGVAAGLVCSLAATRLVRSILFEVSPTDPVVLGGVSVVLVLVASLAAYVPARRATRIDPAEALRAE